MPRSFTFATITEYKAAKGNNGAIYAELVSSGIKSGSCVSKITATGDVFIDSINPFVTPELGQEGDTLYYSSTEGYRFLRAGNTTWDADSYGQVYIDLAKIPSGFSVVAPYTDIFNYKQTDENIGSGKASMTKILGNSVAWNQLFNGDNYAATRGGIPITIKNGHVVGSGTSTTSLTVGFLFSGESALVVGHKYYVHYSGSHSGCTLRFYAGASYAVTDLTESIIVTADGTGNTNYVFKPNSNGESVSFDCYLYFTDLTLLYGSAIDGMTDAQILAKFESEFPGYHSYNAGTLISNKAKAIEFVGFNKVDESTLVKGKWRGTNGIMTDNATRRASETKFPCLPSTEYYAFASPNGAICVCFYDANDTFLIGKDTSTFTTPNNAAYMRFSIANLTSNVCINLSGKRNGQYEPYKKVVLPLPNLDQIKVYSHNIWDEEWESGVYYTYSSSGHGEKLNEGNYIRCKNLISVSENETYYIKSPYNLIFGFYDASGNYIGWQGSIITKKDNTLTVPSGAAFCSFYIGQSGVIQYGNDICINLSSSFNGQYEPHGILTMEGGLKSARSVRDEIVGNKYIKRVGSVDLGSKDYTKSGNWFNSSLSDAKRPLTDTAVPNAICVKYTAASWRSGNVGNFIIAYASASVTSESVLQIGDSSYSSASDFKTDMYGVMLNYELATPIEYEIYSPTKMPFNWKYRVSEYHTKKMLPENGENPTSAPFACEIKQI